MSGTQQLDFVDISNVPSRVWDKEGHAIRERLMQMKQILGSNLVKVVLYPNASHVSYGKGEVLYGAVYYLQKGTPLRAVAPFLGPLYQHITVVNLGKIPKDKIEESRAAWNSIIDPAQTRGSGIPGYGMQDETNLIESFKQKAAVAPQPWSTSLGPSYQALGGIFQTQNGESKLFLYGGHATAHKNLLKIMVSRPDLKIEDLTESRIVLDNENSLSDTIAAVKKLQKINHSFIAGKVMAMLGQGNCSNDPYDHFDGPVDLSYSCFVNTVQAVPTQRGTSTQLYTITQGVVNTSNDIDLGGECQDKVNLYLVESPLRVHEICVNRDYLNVVDYFPVTTGSSETNNFGLSDRDNEANKRDMDTIKRNLSWTGVVGIHNATNLHYQPYDKALKSIMNNLFSKESFVAIESDTAMEGVLFTVPGIDPRNLTTEHYLNYTSHLENSAVIRAPVNSEPVKLIFNTLPQVLDLLRKHNIEKVEPFKLMAADDMSDHFVKVPLWALRHADSLPKENNTPIIIEDLQGLDKISTNPKA